MPVPAKLIDFLNRSNVRYEILHHPEAFTAQELAAIEHSKGRNNGKGVIVKAGDLLVMTVLSSDHRLDLEKLGVITGRRVSLATEADFKASFPDCAVGTMPPFGELYGVSTYLDQS